MASSITSARKLVHSKDGGLECLPVGRKSETNYRLSHNKLEHSNLE
jgi:hypothetical protein